MGGDGLLDRDFKGVWIPKVIWLDSRLSMLDKGIYAEIDSLDKGDPGCFAGNEHFAEFCQCSERKVSESISKLVEYGYVRIASFDGRKRFLRSCLEISARQPSKNCEADSQILLHSNTSSNTSSNERDKSLSPSDERFVEFWNVYPKLVAKAEALKAWRSLKPSAALANTIISDVKHRVATDWKGREKQYIPNAATYIRGKRWEDGSTAGKVQREREYNEETAEDFARRFASS